MSKRVVWMLVICLALPVFAREKREKAEKIGEVSWYTEQNSLDEMKAIAKKASKPIMAVFSATWCGPCQHVKKTVFKTKEFKKVAEKAVLLYVEQTTPEGQVYNKRFKVNSFPTFKILSADGQLMDNYGRERTVKGFSEWIDQVNAGEHMLAYRARLKKNPKDRETMFKLAGKLGWSETEEKIKMLKKVIGLNGDTKDKITHQAYERLMYMLASSFPPVEGYTKETFYKENREFFENGVKAYYPDGFVYELKGSFGMSMVMHWHNCVKDYQKTNDVFTHFLKKQGESFDPAKHMDVVSYALPALLELKRKDEVKKYMAQIKETVKSFKQIKDKQGFFYRFMNINRAMIDYFGKQKETKTLKAFIDGYFADLTSMGYGMMIPRFKPQYAEKYGLYAEEVLKQNAARIKSDKSINRLRYIGSSAKILAKTGKKDKAQKLLMDLYGDQAYLKGLKKSQKGTVINSVAWSMYEIGADTKKAIEIANEAIKLDPSAGHFDTLASLYAKKRDYKKAIEIEKKALGLEDKKYRKIGYTDKIKSWEKKLKK